MTQTRSLPTTPALVRSLDAVLEKRWSRLLVPSLSDMFFLAILAMLCVRGGGVGWSGLLSDADVGWHIRTGEYILDQRRVPHHDLYSFTNPGAVWYAWEWLSDVIGGALHRAAGLKGVVLLAALTIALYAVTLVRRMLSRGVHLCVLLPMALLAVGASSVHFFARPHIFTLLLLSASTWMIEADRERPRSRTWLLVPLTAVWTNLHGGFVSVVAVLGLTTIGVFIEARLSGGPSIRDALRYAKLTLACALASLANPYGWNLHLHIWQYLQSDWILNSVQEFQSPRFRDGGILQFEVLMFAGLIVAGAAWRRKRVVEGLWIVFWAHMALASARHIPVFVAVCAPLIAGQLSDWFSVWIVSRRHNVIRFIDRMARNWLPVCRHTSLLPWAAVAALIATGAPIRWPQDFPKQLFPTELVHAHADLIVRSRVFTTDQWADYLIYTNPQQKVFMDGRSDFYGAAHGTRYVELLNGHWRWQQWLQTYDFDLALLPVPNALAELLKREPGWRILADTGEHVLIVRD